MARDVGTVESLIVSKTRMHRGTCCVGAIDVKSLEPLRLMEADGTYPPSDTAYEVGQVWQVSITKPETIIPPFVEDVCVSSRKLLGSMLNLEEYLRSKISPWKGSPDTLFDGRLQVTSRGRGYVSADGGIPDHSTGFWLPDRELRMENEKTYRYLGTSAIQFIKYVGVRTSIDVIPKGTLVRVSLARWWVPADGFVTEERCYLQLSGWYA